MTSAAAKATAMKSYEMKSKVVINDLTIDTGTNEADASTGQILSMLKNAELTIDGVYQAEPMQTELTTVLNLKGGYGYVLHGSNGYVRTEAVRQSPFDSVLADS
ncbi:hypothetical protein ACFSQ7_00310 [Paenibacillus rhizoplanae]